MQLYISGLHVFICVLVKYVCLADLCAVGSVDKCTLDFSFNKQEHFVFVCFFYKQYT